MTSITAGDPTTYRMSSAHALRLAGPLAITVGMLWVLGAVSGALDGVGGALAVVTAVAVALAAILLLRPPRVLELSAEGYRVSFARGAGERSASWRQVDGVGTRRVRGVACLVFSLGGDRATLVPLSLLGARGVEAQREVRARLDTAHGYRYLGD